jgi:hypothetical protein
MVVVLEHLTHKNVLIPCTKDELGFSSTHGTTKPNSHTDMRRIKRASKMLLRIAPESWVGDSNVDDDRFAASIVVRQQLNPKWRALARRHLVPFGFSGPVFDLDLICFFFRGGSI